ncbi:hypothetical protein CJD35_16115 [Sphingobium xenophagum]|uniref:Uncharacterized protein n=1 Tax=Sphingobium xenophagum TaxID=121428 RepID=A0A249MXD5_SPHXE|nr:toprim domain-containing protein [Sphingobium xenophagum]ASY46040.1 hypothetical protein CJD35_16115 [Sphingobium xenophagum]
MDAHLDAMGARLVRKFGGVWSNGRGMCRCPAHPDKTPSLSVRCGHSALLFKCFAGCTINEIFHAFQRENFSIKSTPSPTNKIAGQCKGTDRAARQIWEQSLPLVGTAGERYLIGRSIAYRSAALRYHPATPLGAGKSVRFMPAILAAVTHRCQFLGLQRIFLDLDGRPASMIKHKRTLGRPRHGAVALSPANEVLGLAEGVETALSASMLLGVPVWATLGAERLDRIVIPEEVTRLILLADNDRAGRRAVDRARLRYALAGREIVVLWPPAPFTDWNDMLQAGGKGEAEGVRLAA